MAARIITEYDYVFSSDGQLKKYKSWLDRGTAMELKKGVNGTRNSYSTLNVSHLWYLYIYIQLNI